MPKQCNLCDSQEFILVVDLGQMPIAHRFLKTRDELVREFKHPFRIIQCTSCGLLQIEDPIEPAMLYKDGAFCFSSWKPQPHMSAEITELKRLGLSGESVILEIGCNEGTFLKQLLDLGPKNLLGVEPNKASGANAKRVPGATIYNTFFDNSLADRILNDFGGIDVIVSRQVVEHIPDLRSLMNSVRRLLKPSGVVMFEVPDFTEPMKFGDLSSLWEEHVNYFTQSSLNALFASSGFNVRTFKRYPFCAGAIAAFATKTESSRLDYDPAVDVDLELGKNFSLRASQFKGKLVEILKKNRNASRKNIVYGSGCRACTFINSHGIGDLFDFAVDDQPEKRGLLMPGCGLEVRSPDELSSVDGDCFLSVNHENEAKVIQKNQNFRGEFFSLNSPSPLFETVLTR